MTLLDSSVASLRQRVRHLRDDFKSWEQLTAPGSDLRQHNSQVRRITETLKGVIADSISGKPIDPDAPQGAAALGDLPHFRRSVGSIHLIWEFFRDKFAQRRVDSFQDHLGAADDFAWECYRPFMDAAVQASTVTAELVKEPPLVCYDNYRAPFAQARTKSFEVQGLSPDDVGQFVSVLMNLPVPVIGFPWADINRTPSLVVVGHEVGHVIAEDLKLADEVEEQFKVLEYPHDAGGKRKAVWRLWSDEVFGDIFGVLATGTAFVIGLAAELASDIDEVRRTTIDKEKPGHYPTPTLRMAICEAALRDLDIEPPSIWSGIYEELIGNSLEFKDDVDLVVDAILNSKWKAFGKKTLKEILPWSPDHEQQALEVANAKLQSTTANVDFSVRVWIAAAMVAWQLNSAKYVALKLDQEMSHAIVKERGVAVRFEHAENLRSDMLGGLTADEHRDRIRALDHQAGRQISRSLGL